MELPPLSLYVHLPWCVRKCPYCDFNSHAVKGELPGDEYVNALILDLEKELPLVWGRPVHSVFFGGGTPSLFSAAQIDTLLCAMRGLLRLSPDAEVTLEANPGTIEHDSFSAYRNAGVNRISLGVQSFDESHLADLGRIHGAQEIEQSVASIKRSGIDNFNIDLMFALPGQSLKSALRDVRTAIACNPTHISRYQLTIEPNTAFHANPPVLPDDDLAWKMQQQGGRLLSEAGFDQYEISAWSRAGFQCRHNVNYWRYGDFLGIGAGAHGKVTIPSENAVRRRIRQRHPVDWMKAVTHGSGLAEDRKLDAGERVFEFFLNQLRLREGVLKNQLEPRTGVAWGAVSERVRRAVDKGLLREDNTRLTPTELGWRFSNEVQALFLP
ncbi:MAG: oxygen-independent coproporphyrinogen III oxidase-like protein [Xanthomonadales bacterium]|nr:radical SAM family heme chaperone HemW [Gammaproteobacteria bacterium]MBT8055082.1 radical SAM family heme chaperone HemW [Gammaproteobacteria bacterium]NND58235.1 oxygen-independent coproporphyrinogen III oxidase-like protein [Xanthomonadales bacterium]NNK51676.1 oxygen-independent coproporphyrinogen III oxidase-like protein [Xanthomonadales bacterium]